MLSVGFLCWDPHLCPSPQASLGNRRVFWWQSYRAVLFLISSLSGLSTLLISWANSVLFWACSEVLHLSGRKQFNFCSLGLFILGEEDCQELIEVGMGRWWVLSSPHAIADRFWLVCDFRMKLNQSLSLSYTFETLVDKEAAYLGMNVLSLCPQKF